MTLKVLNVFRDKYDAAKVYKPGDVVQFVDDDRCKDLIQRGLCEAVKKTSQKTKEPEKVEEPVEETPEKADAPVEEAPEVTAEKPETAEAPAEEEKPVAKAPKSGTSKKGSKK